MAPEQPANESNLGILSDLASQQQPSHSTPASTSRAFDPFHPAVETRSLGGVGTGAGVGIDTTMAPAQRIYSPSSRSHARVDTGLEEGEATPLLNTVGLHEEGEGGGTHEVDYNFFGTARGFGTRVSPAENGAGGSVEGYKGKRRMSAEEEEAQWLVEMDASADMGLAASTKYQEEIVAVMARLSTAMGRTEELQDVVSDMHTELENGQAMRIAAPGTVQVTLPWFKHFYGRDLPPNEDGEARDRYLAAIRHVPWTPTERKLLKHEVISQNNREVAMLASLAGEDMEEKLASYDPSYFVESTELLDWEKIALVIPRRSPIECKIQWLQKDHPGINNGPWSNVEITKLAAYATERNFRDWEGVAEALGTKRTVAACIKQYRKKSGERKDWTPEEDDLLREGVRLYGTNWQSVALLVGRHSNQCINRWTKTLREGIKRGKWQPDEDEQLRVAVKMCGTNWRDVERQVRGRTDAQCRERWVNILDPNLLPRKIWSAEDDATLVRCKDEEGQTWSAISHIFEGRRTDNHCQRRYAELKRLIRHPVHDLPPAVPDAIIPIDPSLIEPPQPASRKRKRAVPPLPIGEIIPGQFPSAANAAALEDIPLLPAPKPKHKPPKKKKQYVPEPLIEEAPLLVPSPPLLKRKPGRPKKIIDPNAPIPVPLPKRPIGRPRKIIIDPALEVEVDELEGCTPPRTEEGMEGLGEAVRMEVEREEGTKRSRSGRVIKGRDMSV